MHADFNARARAANFEASELPELMAYLHARVSCLPTACTWYATEALMERACPNPSLAEFSVAQFAQPIAGQCLCRPAAQPSAAWLGAAQFVYG